MESVYEGWLTKSPRHKRGPFGLFTTWQHWRRRYFVLFSSSSKVVFNYYEDDNKLQTKKGTIDLENCEEIVDNVESSYYRYIFLIRTIHKGRRRTYYLAAEADEELKSWVENLRSSLNLHEDKNFLNKVHQGLQSSMKKSLSRNGNRCHARCSSKKEKGLNVDLKTQTHFDSDDSQKALSFSKRKSRSRSLSSEEETLSATPTDCLHTVIAGGSIFYARRNSIKAKSYDQLLGRTKNEVTVDDSRPTRNGSTDSNFGSNESFENKQHSSPSNISWTKSSNLKDTVISDESNTFTDNSVKSETFGDIQTTVKISPDDAKTGLQFNDSSEVVCVEFSIEEIETLIFNDSRQLDDFEEREKMIRHDGETKEVLDRLLFTLASPTSEKQEAQGLPSRATSSTVDKQQFLCLTKGSRRYRKHRNAKSLTGSTNDVIVCRQLQNSGFK